MDLKLINAFLAAEAANETEKLVQVNVQSLNDGYNKTLARRNDLVSTLKKTEEDLLKFSGALENQLSMAEFLAKQKGLQPLEPSEEKTEGMSTSDSDVAEET